MNSISIFTPRFSKASLKCLNLSNFFIELWSCILVNKYYYFLDFLKILSENVIMGIIIEWSVNLRIIIEWSANLMQRHKNTFTLQVWRRNCKQQNLCNSESYGHDQIYFFPCMNLKIFSQCRVQWRWLITGDIFIIRLLLSDYSSLTRSLLTR